MPILPHDSRVMALEAVFSSRYTYGLEYEPLTAGETRKITKTLETSLWGDGRPDRSRAVLWGLLCKGHRLLSLLQTVRACVRLIYDMLWQHRNDSHKSQPVRRSTNELTAI